jgi:hypothetical protein
MARTARAIAAVAGGAALVLGLAACGTPPWEDQGSGSGAARASATPSRIVVVHNDLATGSVKRTLQAGDIKLDVTYYSSLDIGKWTATADKPLSLSASATLDSDQGQNVYLNRITVSTTVQGPKGALPAPAAQSDQASVQPGYFIKHPYAYGPTFILPPVSPSATSLLRRMNSIRRRSSPEPIR